MGAGHWGPGAIEDYRWAGRGSFSLMESSTASKGCFRAGPGQAAAAGAFGNLIKMKSGLVRADPGAGGPRGRHSQRLQGAGGPFFNGQTTANLGPTKTGA